jgi:hypothetical protein
VAVWPGDLQGETRTGWMTYADMCHAEHQDYGLAGLVPFAIQQEGRDDEMCYSDPNQLEPIKLVAEYVLDLIEEH